MPGLEDWIDVFRAGRHTASSGQTAEYSTADLDKVVSSYDPAHFEAPAVVGHPEDNAPAYAWVKGVRRVGDVLQVRFGEVDPGFANLVKSGRFKNRSISLYPDLRLRHVGFLGAVPPAVKGLKPIAFNDGDQTPVEIIFKEDHMPDPQKPLTVEELKTQLDKLASDFTETKIENAKLKQELDGLKAAAPKGGAPDKPAEFSETPEYKAMAEKIEKLQGETRAAKAREFCEPLVREGRLTTAQRDLIVPLLSQADALNVRDFGESLKTSTAELVKKLVESLPKQVEFGEWAKDGKPAANAIDPVELGRKIREYSEKHGVDLITAKDAVLKEERK